MCRWVVQQISPCYTYNHLHLITIQIKILRCWLCHTEVWGMSIYRRTESHLYCFSFLINISISSLLREMWCDGSVAESKEGCQYFQKVNIPIQAIGMCGKPQYWYCWSANITSIYCPILKSSHDDESIPIFLRIEARLWVNLTSSLTPLPWCCE